MPAIVGGALAALAVVVGVVSAVSDDGGPRTVTTVVLDTTGSATTAPSPGVPPGTGLPATADGWTLTATDPAVVNLELDDLGRVEVARADAAVGTGLVVSLVPDREDGRIVVERLRHRLGGASQGPVPLGGLSSEGIAQSQGPATAVSFASADRVVIVIAPGRDVAAALAGAVSRAIG